MGHKNETSRVTRIWNSLSYKIGSTVARYPVITIIFCLVLSAVMSIKLALTPKVSAIDGYASDDSMSRHEFKTFQQFLDSDGPGITTAILIRSSITNGSLLEEQRLKEVVKVSDFISTNFKLNVSGVEKNFNQFCRGFCQANEPVRQYYNGLQILGKNQTDGISKRIDLSYPTSNFFGRKFSLIPNFFGISMSPEGQHLNSSNLIVLYFRAERYPDWSTKTVKQWELRVRDHFAKEYSSDLIIVDVMSQTVVESEIVRAGLSLQPFLIVGFVIMSIFCTVTTMFSAVYLYSQKATFNKVALSIIACINPFMACGTAMGILFFCGVTFSPIMCITPFLVLAISVDDSFLMLHAWNRLESWRTAPLDKPMREHMMGEVLVETGPAISISAFTNMLAFTIGAITSPPEIRIFCFGNAAAIFMDMFYQATFYTACMTLLGDTKNSEGVSEKTKRIQERMGNVVGRFLKWYVNAISNIFVSFGIVLVWAVFIGFAVLGLTRLHVELRPSKFFLKDSPMLYMDRLRTNEVVPYYTPVHVIVNNPGDLTNDSNVERLVELKEKLEHMPNAIGAPSTKFFLDDFVQYRSSFAEEIEMDIAEDDSESEKSDIEQFLEWPEFSFWRGFLRFDNQTHPHNVTKFMFTTGFHGQDLKDWNKRGQLLKRWRGAVEEFKDDFNTTVFTEDAFFLDMIDSIPTVTWQTTLATFIFVSLVCFLFISDILTVMIVSVATLVTSVGVFGYLSLLGVTLDPVIMSIAIMCIGFSVDIPAHVAFHFYAAKAKKHASSHSQPSPHQVTSPDIVHSTSTTSSSDSSISTPNSFETNLNFALSSVGFPVIQAGVSTDFCALPLGFMELYMAKMFALSLTLCVSLSLIHGLIVIPALLSVQHHIVHAVKRCFGRN
ncbi:SSD domain-containing protein [Caenorhabditis elegans]|uniref:SSD domain-containing protein n=1 Tax=Caenorhabditis elegans TaxID=6239 RepID=Q20404_CAEEL|nr:SSD domain-containing protein [Caenorhabditis elegans]CAA85455.1 SSD domain-containing protein [Caenorhabditis elegans]|eukprot:NP_496343.1 PaTched Related family [Caenorhabditis elegans]